MKTWLAALAVALTAGLFAPLDAEAKRLGGGKSLGMQRNSTPDAPKPAPGSTPPQQGAAPAAAGTPGAATAAAPAAATGAAAAAGKRSWLGPVAGLAAGLGLVALMSSLGLGEEFANFLMLALLAVAVIALVMFVMRRFGRNAAPAMARGPQLATAGGAPFGGLQTQRVEPQAEPMQRTALAPAPVIGSALGASAAVPAAASTLPADFDVEGFQRIAKAIFVRMQDANDRADLDDLRQFTTPELFSHLRVDLLDRGELATATEVVAVDARVLEVTEEGGQQVVSVGYTGQVREDAGAAPAAFDEVWHLVRPADGSRNWAIAGIQQRA
jgi:predicted lipid-binding transport protein (Tim44 family)